MNEHDEHITYKRKLENYAGKKVQQVASITMYYGC